MQLIPLPKSSLTQSEEEKRAYSWDYLYENLAETVVDELLSVTWKPWFIRQSLRTSRLSNRRVWWR